MVPVLARSKRRSVEPSFHAALLGSSDKSRRKFLRVVYRVVKV